MLFGRGAAGASGRAPAPARSSSLASANAALIGALRSALFTWVNAEPDASSASFMPTLKARAAEEGSSLTEVLGCHVAAVPRSQNFLLKVPHGAWFGNRRDHAQLVMDFCRGEGIDLAPLLADGEVLGAMLHEGLSSIGSCGLFERVARVYVEKGRISELLSGGRPPHGSEAKPLLTALHSQRGLSWMRTVASLIREHGKQAEFAEALRGSQSVLDGALCAASVRPEVFFELAHALSEAPGGGVHSRVYPACEARAALGLGPSRADAEAQAAFEALVGAMRGAVPKPERLAFAEVVSKAVSFLGASGLTSRVAEARRPPAELVALVSKPEGRGYRALAQDLSILSERRCAELGAQTREAAEILALPAVALTDDPALEGPAVAGVVRAFLMPGENQPSLRLLDALRVSERYERLKTGFRLRKIARPGEVPALFLGRDGEPTRVIEVPGSRGVTIRELSNEAALDRERLEMRHCGGVPWSLENSENLHKFSIRGPDGRAIASLDLVFLHGWRRSDETVVSATGPRVTGFIRKDPAPAGPGDTSQLAPAARDAIDWLYAAIGRGELECTGEGRITRAQSIRLAEKAGFDVLAPGGEAHWLAAFNALRSVEVRGRQRWIPASIQTPREFLFKHQIVTSLPPR